MEKKSKQEFPHQELHEFLNLLFSCELNKPKDYYYDFDESPSLYLSLNSRNYTNENEKNDYSQQLRRLYLNTIEGDLKYSLRGLHVCCNPKLNKYVFLHTSHISHGIERRVECIYSEFGVDSYFQYYLPEERAHEVLFQRDRKYIDTFNFFSTNVHNDFLLDIPFFAIKGIIVSK